MVNSVGLIVAFSFLVAACNNNAPSAPPSSEATEVSVITVVPGKAVISQDLPGRLSAVRSAQVRARVEGVIEKQLFIEGSDVVAGTPLYRIDPRTFQANAVAAEVAVASARAVVDRYAPLLSIKAVSQQEFDTANAQLRQSEAAQARARLDLENATPKAPITGRIGRSNVTEGSLTSKDAGTHLVTIEQLDPIRVDFVRYYSDVLRLQQAIKSGKQKRADAAVVELLQEDGSVYPEKGTVRFSDMAVDPSSGSILLRAEFPNPRRELLPGTFVAIRFPQALIDDAFRVPQRAVTVGAQGQTIMIVDSENKVQVRTVKTSGIYGGNFVVTDGLKAGELVIVDGLQKAHPGSIVKVLPWQPEQPVLPLTGQATRVEKNATH